MSVKRVRHWSAPSYTRVVIDLSNESAFSHHLLSQDPSIDKPRRLYVDIEGAVLGNVKKSVAVNDGLLLSVRAGQHAADTVRVVLDIANIQDYKIFQLHDPHRIVIDITGAPVVAIGDVAEDGANTPKEEAQGHAPSAVTEAPEGAVGTAQQEGALKPMPPPAPTTPTVKEGAASIKPPPSVDLPGAGLKAPLKKKRPVIVIDPGHGGHDPGAIGRRGLREKDVTLKIAKLLKQSIEKETGAHVLLTRDNDRYVPLDERTAIANGKGSDLFISVHVNANPNRKVSGVETYYLDISHDRRVMDLAARENASTAKATNDLQFILADLIRTANRVDSSQLADRVQERLVGSLRSGFGGVEGNGVKGAPFYVLVRTNMPAILVEVSFISNQTEEKRLRDDEYLGLIADGITDGVRLFMKSSNLASTDMEPSS